MPELKRLAMNSQKERNLKRKGDFHSWNDHDDQCRSDCRHYGGRVLCLIPVLFQIRRTAQQVEKTLETARMQIVPVSHDLTIISQEVNGLSSPSIDKWTRSKTA